MTRPDQVQPDRLVSLDAYRGFTMLMMASAGFGFPQVARRFPESGFWQFLGYQFDHVPWTGCGYWDLIQPCFMFIVGVAMPFSFARRTAAGESKRDQLLHAFVRSLILIALGIFLSSTSSKQTNFTFVNVLTQIGLGYIFLFLLLGTGIAVQTLTAVGILAGYWALFYFHPVPGPQFQAEAMGIPADWQQFPAGLAVHWNKHVNFAGWADRYFLNWFPREKPFVVNDGGYQTLNFIPSMATMLFGVMAGQVLQSAREPVQKCALLASWGLAFLVLGMLLDHTIWPTWLADAVDPRTGEPASYGIDEPYRSRAWTICPIVKRIWTPTWAIFSTGWALVLLAGFYWVIDIRGWQKWSFPLVVVGMNSIAMYCMSQLIKPFLARQINIHISSDLFKGDYGPIIERCAVLLLLWLICWWLYRQRVFFKI